MRLTAVLRAWSELHASTPRKSLSWNSADLLIQSAKALDVYVYERLQKAIETSNEKLAPLGEPLKLNLGQHRWLSADREESYSDWLAWIIQGISGGTEILRLFALADEAKEEFHGPVGNVRREAWSEHGRTDIEVDIGKRSLLLIEVKVKNTGSELPLQLERYAQKVAEQPIDSSMLVLLGTEAPDSSLPRHNFNFTDWRALCLRLRQYAYRAKKLDSLRAAAILLFCGAVEQNLLGLSNGQRHLRALSTVDYLDEWRREI